MNLFDYEIDGGLLRPKSILLFYDILINFST